MNLSRPAGFAAIGLALLLPGLGRAEVEILKQEPAAGQLRRGQIVYVDDGKCPRGEVKEITGGSREKSVPRKVRCVKRPK